MTRTKRPADYNTKNIWEGCGKCNETGSVSWGIDVAGIVTLMQGDKVVGERVVTKVCFDCNGACGKYVSQAQLDRREKDRARREAKRAAKLADAVTAREAFKAEHPDVYAWMDSDAANSFAASLMESFLANTLNGRPALSPKQLEAAKKSIEKDAERTAQREAERAAASPVPTGRETITGEIVSIKTEENIYSYGGGTVTKMLVKDARGFKVWGTMPTALADALYDAWYAGEQAAKGDDFYWGDYGPDYWQDSAKGRTVTFTATLSPSNDDETFGFFKRPTKAAVIEN